MAKAYGEVTDFIKSTELTDVSEATVSEWILQPANSAWNLLVVLIVPDGDVTDTAISVSVGIAVKEKDTDNELTLWVEPVETPVRTIGDDLVAQRVIFEIYSAQKFKISLDNALAAGTVTIYYGFTS